MLKSFGPLLEVVIPSVTGGAIVMIMIFAVFALIDADKEERLGIIIKSILALIVIIVLAIIATLTLSFIFLIIFIVAAIWLSSQ